jgi:glycosyltransferase involved in cell wall biosynthesis
VKITILQGAFLPVPPLRGGAIEKAWQGLGEAFVQAGHEVIHISRLWGELPAKETIRGVQHIRVRGARATQNGILLKLREFFYVWRARKVLPEADILVTHAFWAPILFPKDKYGKIYVHVGRCPKGQMGIYKKADRLQVPTQAVACVVAAELKKGDDRVRTIPYPLPFSVPSNMPLADRPKRVLFMGRIHPEKGVLELLQAWQGLGEPKRGDWTLRLVGPWREEDGGGGKAFLNKLKNMGGSSVEICDPIFEESDLIKEYQSAPIFVYPSLAKKGETFGLAVLEAMNCGCVPLVSSLPCFEDFIQDGVNGSRAEIDSLDGVGKFANALCALLTCASLEEKSQQAIQTAKKYEIGMVTEKFLEDFNKILSS